MEKKEYRFTLHPLKQCEFWRLAVSRAMREFSYTLPDVEYIKWWWGYANGQQSWTCRLECSAERFEKIKEYIDSTIPGEVFDWSMTD